MAEQSTFARRMMAQKLMAEARDDPFSDSPFFSVPKGQSKRISDFAQFGKPALGSITPYQVGATGSLFAPGAGIADVFGYAPDPMQSGQMLPSFGENIGQGKYLDAGLQTLGVAGDVMMAGGAFVPPLVGVGAALKAPRAARVADAAVDAAKNVDEARAALEASPNDPVLKQQYLDLRRVRDTELSQMPPTEQLKLDTNYRMDHQPRGPQDGGGRLDDITAGGELFPDDVYSANGLRFYGNPNNSFDQQSHAAILAARGNPEAEITIYRGVPIDVNQINAGDWVTLSPDYAAMHAASGYGPNGDQAGKVISQRVKVKDVFSDGNDLNEFGYFPADLAELGVKKVVPPKPDEPGIIAFHGSGADFDEFRLEMIGTGEGAQAYGYGLYFTDSEDIAKFYRDSLARGRSSIVYEGSAVKNARQTDGLTDREMILDNIATEMAFFDQKPENVIKKKINNLKQKIDDPVDISASAGDVEAQELADLIRQSAQRELEIYENLDPSKFTRGKMYKVGLAPKPDELLDYDLPLSQQSDFIKNNPLIKQLISEDASYRQRYPSSPIGERHGGNVLTTISEAELNASGIKGLKYRAAGSRGANVDTADAEMNYVIFDDKAIKILEKYGIVGPVAVTAAGTAAVNRGRNDNDNGGSILPDAGML